MAVRGGLRQRRAALEDQWTRVVPELAARRPEPGRRPAPPGGSGENSTAGKGEHSGGAPGDPGDAEPRPEVTDSWRRSLSTVDPGRDSAPVTDAGEVAPRWDGSPLRGPITELAPELRSIADDAGFIAAVTDASGTILWTCGGRVMRRRAERVNFMPGGRWDEPAMGTNALSLALRTGRPSSVFSAEHLVTALHGWACYCAPVRDAEGRTLGVLDLSTTWDRSHPLAMTTVRTLVSTLEARLRTEPGPAPAAGPPVRLSCLGRQSAVREGRVLRLPPRQWEILTLLALDDGGWSPERLRYAVYGERPVAASTFKAEVSHLRSTLGGGITKGTYALTVPVLCDAAEVLRALRESDTAAALARYRGPLLPRSEAPGITEWRARLEVAVRQAVLNSGDPEHALKYGELAPYDIEVHEHALRLLPSGDSRRGIPAGRLDAALRS
ncbi:helix-turn-helix domain-containing protein [Streptomyces sp. SCSIO ZS0520]|uniref:helix-turn-helix domain-containing protein n=1 Tax=Streptomyces sp. SCSIO ZS0520 TaxID=2892996 RepID=UPI0021D938A7|nr:helix-turn-helix domain-containing protein [Streptomyces sp. SCSIO ZS0520]